MPARLARPLVQDNRVYNRAGKLNAKLCDTSNTVAKVPSDDDVVAMGMAVLQGKHARTALVEEEEL